MVAAGDAGVRRAVAAEVERQVDVELAHQGHQRLPQRIETAGEARPPFLFDRGHPLRGAVPRPAAAGREEQVPRAPGRSGSQPTEAFPIAGDALCAAPREHGALRKLPHANATVVVDHAQHVAPNGQWRRRPAPRVVVALERHQRMAEQKRQRRGGERRRGMRRPHRRGGSVAQRPREDGELPPRAHIARRVPGAAGAVADNGRLAVEPFAFAHAQEDEPRGQSRHVAVRAVAEDQHHHAAVAFHLHMTAFARRRVGDDAGKRREQGVGVGNRVGVLGGRGRHVLVRRARWRVYVTTRHCTSVNGGSSSR